MPFKKCLDYSTFGAIQNLTTLCTKRRLSKTEAPLICYIVVSNLIVLWITLYPKEVRVRGIWFGILGETCILSRKQEKGYRQEEKEEEEEICLSFKHFRGHTNYNEHGEP
jgi:hypothetical protein